MDEKNRNYGYDIIRTLSCFFVVLYHYACELRVCNNKVTLFNIPIISFESLSGHLANIGVICFFILSGACIWHGNRDISVSKFYKKRFFSIYPAFWIAYIVVQGAKILIKRSFFMGKNPLLYFLSLLGIDGYFEYLTPNFYCVGEWFLGAIILAYACFPLMRYCFMKLRWLFLILFFSVTCFICLDNCFVISPIRNMFTVLFCFYIGMLFEEYKDRILNNLVVRIVLGILCLVLFILFNQLLIFRILHSVVFFSTIVWIFSSQEKMPVIIKRLGLFFSKISYAVFLLHHVILSMVCKLVTRITVNINFEIVFFLCLLIIILTSWLFTCFINKITIRCGGIVKA